MSRQRSLTEAALIINDNIGLVFKLAFKFTNSLHLNQDETISDTYLSCVELTQYWDELRGNLSTYLFNYAQCRLMRTLDKRTCLVTSLDIRRRLEEAGSVVPTCLTINGREDVVDSFHNYEEDYADSKQSLIRCLVDYLESKSVDSRTQFIILAFYHDDLKLVDISSVLGISHQRVQQILSKFRSEFTTKYGRRVREGMRT